MYFLFLQKYWRCERQFFWIVMYFFDSVSSPSYLLEGYPFKVESPIFPLECNWRAPNLERLPKKGFFSIKGFLKSFIYSRGLRNALFFNWGLLKVLLWSWVPVSSTQFYNDAPFRTNITRSSENMIQRFRCKIDNDGTNLWQRFGNFDV